MFYVSLFILAIFFVVILFAVSERQEKRAVPTTQVEERGLVATECLGREVVFEEVEDLGLGVGVVEPDSSNVGWVSSVVGELVGIEIIPAIRGQLICL